MKEAEMDQTIDDIKISIVWSIDIFRKRYQYKIYEISDNKSKSRVKIHVGMDKTIDDLKNIDIF